MARLPLKFLVKEAIMMAKNVRITLTKSLIACKKDQIATAHSLGLKKPGDVTIQPANAQTTGKVKKIVHLIEVSEA